MQYECLEHYGIQLQGKSSWQRSTISSKPELTKPTSIDICLHNEKSEIRSDRSLWRPLPLDSDKDGIDRPQTKVKLESDAEDQQSPHLALELIKVKTGDKILGWPATWKTWNTEENRLLTKNLKNLGFYGIRLLRVQIV